MALAATGAQAQSPAMEDMVRPGDVIDFAAQTLSYDEAADVVTAEGEVTVAREGYRLRADRVVYNRQTGQVRALGDVIVVDPDGNQAFGDEVEVSESLRDAAIENILIVLEGGGRAAADKGRRTNGVTTLDRAVYSPCAVEDRCGPIKPVWQIKAVRVVHDPARSRIYYRDARLEIGGVPVFFLPRFSHPARSGERAPGFLTPEIRLSQELGLSLEFPYHVPLAPNADITLTPFVFTNANPMLGAEYRRLFDDGPVKAGGLVTYSGRLSEDDPLTGEAERKDSLRGYVYANGQLQFSPNWRGTFSLRATSDDTFLRRYSVSQDDVLRNLLRAERFDTNSYFTVEGWAFQGLRLDDKGRQTPVAIPLVEYRWRPKLTLLGGQFDVLANTLTIARTGGEDMTRALAQLRYTRLITTPLGQRVMLTGQLRGDAYHMSDTEDAFLPIYAGEDGWKARFVPTAAVDISWPFAGPALGGVQTLTPRFQFVATPVGLNDDIANEDSRAIDLETVNLFSLNRFPGYDRVEGGARIAYGLEWRLDRPRWRAEAEIGQSLRFSGEDNRFPLGTGLTRDFSDIVGRLTLAYGRNIALTHRFRLDQKNLKVRRTEVDLTVGDVATYVQLAYTRLDRDIQIEDLRDREEIRGSGRLALSRYWSAFGAAIVDLTSIGEDPISGRDGFQPIRTQLGAAYEDECFSISLAWRRDFIADRDDRVGDEFLFRIALKNLGR